MSSTYSTQWRFDVCGYERESCLAGTHQHVIQDFDIIYCNSINLFYSISIARIAVGRVS